MFKRIAKLALSVHVKSHCAKAKSLEALADSQLSRSKSVVELAEKALELAKARSRVLLKESCATSVEAVKLRIEANRLNNIKL